MVIELAAGRVLAPHVGVSLYTWTSIIGVVLAGISLGAYAGGRLADRRPRESTLGWLLFASGVTSMLIGPATTLFAGDGGVLTTYGIAPALLQRVVVLSALLFFLPSFFLGMISPVAVKLAVRDLDSAGSVVGKIYALSTLGSIAGTFTTGFYLVARFGTRATLIGVGVVLIACALLFTNRFGRAAAVLLLALGAAFAGFWPGATLPPEQETLLRPGETGTLHVEESQYYTIAVQRTLREDTGGIVHTLQLDHLVHSYSDPDDPQYLEYGYLRIFNEVAQWAMAERELPRYLFIGGGGYTLPRLLSMTDAEIDVVEIDPAVTRVARRFFGLPRESSIRTINEDARWFAMNAPADQYDVIFIDAFNDLSVPYHLTTREYSVMLRRMLRPGGALVVNLVDDYHRGRFLGSYIRTLQAVFGARNVSLVTEGREDLESVRSTFVVIASASQFPINGYVLPSGVLQRYAARPGTMVLTDDHAPVDNMLAPLFTERFADEETTE
ncbi:MAG TPA: fused MFS/spermidine synthase [Thermoanaerobaculia bacterium]|nr:fused MFS/spermidine synthase [Thermoanaerobaculia bacterium]